jgi:hypothetical protein
MTSSHRADTKRDSSTSRQGGTQRRRVRAAGRTVDGSGGVGQRGGKKREEGEMNMDENKTRCR